MGTAFSSSLFGLAGAIVLGLLDLQVSQAQNRFFPELEEWMSSITRHGSGSIAFEGEQSVPAYIEALLAPTAESLDGLQKTMARAEDGRTEAHRSMQDRTGVVRGTGVSVRVDPGERRSIKNK